MVIKVPDSVASSIYERCVASLEKYGEDFYNNNYQNAQKAITRLSKVISLVGPTSYSLELAPPYYTFLKDKLLFNNFQNNVQFSDAGIRELKDIYSICGFALCFKDYLNTYYYSKYQYYVFSYNKNVYLVAKDIKNIDLFYSNEKIIDWN